MTTVVVACLLCVCCVCVCARACVCWARHRGLRRPSAETKAVVVCRDRGGVVGLWCVCVCARVRVCLSATALRDRAVASTVRARVGHVTAGCDGPRDRAVANAASCGDRGGCCVA